LNCGNTADCEIKKSANCNSAYDVNCNIRLGIRFFVYLKSKYGNGVTYPAPGTRQTDGDYTCPKKQYTGFQAALRAYNGLGCSKGQDTYVEDVLARPISAEHKAVLDKVYS
jgi:hypothetical protein